mgnify:CR=1 FL=1
MKQPYNPPTQPARPDSALSASSAVTLALPSFNSSLADPAAPLSASPAALAADFTAPLAYYPHPRFLGLKEAMHVDRYFSTAGLNMLQLYDPERIPIVCVHGLISVPSMWRDTIDAVESESPS